MAERLTFEQMEKTAQKPRGVSDELWVTGMAVAEELMQKGEPTNVLEDSVAGPNMPNTYEMTELGVTVEHMPHWAYAIVSNGEARSHVLFTARVQPVDPKEPYKRRVLSPEVVILKINTAIARAVPQRLKG